MLRQKIVYNIKTGCSKYSLSSRKNRNFWDGTSARHTCSLCYWKAGFTASCKKQKTPLHHTVLIYLHFITQYSEFSRQCYREAKFCTVGHPEMSWGTSDFSAQVRTRRDPTVFLNGLTVSTHRGLSLQFERSEEWRRIFFVPWFKLHFQSNCIMLQ